MTVSTTIICTRWIGNEHQDIRVTVEGQIEHYSSYNPNESGPCVEDVVAVEPDGFTLTGLEYARAQEQLEREWL